MEFLTTLDIRSMYFFIPVILFIHEMEEWNIYEFHQKSFKIEGINETKLGERLWLLFLSMVGFIWTIIAYFIPDRLAGTVFLMVLVDFTLLNGIQHIGLTLKIKKYNPGLIFGGMIGLAMDGVIIWKIAIDQIMPVWGLVLIICLIIPGLVDSIRSKDRLPKMIELILRFSNKLAKIMTE